MITVGIVGCGKVADQHATQIQRIPGAVIVGVCDTEPLMARQLAARFHVARQFTDLGEMLNGICPTVVHVTTPPAGHFELARMCLEAGVHVYVEKPFTMTAPEAEDLIALASVRGLKITAGHNAQFTHAMVRMRELVHQGYLGGAPVHIESLYGYDFGAPAYAQAVLGDSGHWVRALPGSLVQNIMSHGVSRIAEFLHGDTVSVNALGFTSGFLRDIGQGDIIDEVRVLIQDAHSTTAYFSFSSQIKPSLHQLRLYGPKNSLIVDDDHQLLLRLADREYKSYARYFIPPMQFASQYLGNLSTNFGRFLRRDFHMPFDAGLKTLIEAFYRSIVGAGPLPLPYREILVTARIMDAIVAQMSVPRHAAGRSDVSRFRVGDEVAAGVAPGDAVGIDSNNGPMPRNPIVNS